MNEQSIFKCLERIEIYSCKWFKLFRDRVMLPQGSVIPAQHIVHFERPAVGAIVEDVAGRILLVKVYRYVTNSHQWEIPAGGVDIDESVADAAVREVLEESGYTIHEVRELFTYYPMNGISDMTYHAVCAKLDSTFDQQGFDESEVSEQRWIDINGLQLMLKRGEIKCGMTLTAILYFLNMRQ